MDLRQRMVGAQMRTACSAAIYRKTLRMSKMATTQTSAGNVVNLLSNDVSRLDYGFIFVHYIWILPIQGNCVSCSIQWPLKFMCFIIFSLLPSPPTIHICSVPNLLFNLAASEICGRRRCRWAAAENGADTNWIIESLVHPEV